MAGNPHGDGGGQGRSTLSFQIGVTCCFYFPDSYVFQCI